MTIDKFIGVFRHLSQLLAFFAVLLLPQWVSGQERADVRLVIDVSGSMKLNDPQNLRQPAVDLLVQLLPEGSRAGVWTFGKYVNMLIPHQDVDDPWRTMARQNAQQINSVALFTNIGEALEKASTGMGRTAEGFKQSIILLTDGMVDIDKDSAKNQKEWRRIVDQVIPNLKESGITVHTVALSDHADVSLLEKIALATNGTAAVAKNADDLMRIFLKAFDVAAPAQQVPLNNNSFAVDSSVEEFTALIFRQQSDENTQLVGPDQAVLDQTSQDPDLSWFRSVDYDLITVRKPLEGEWVVRANVAPESRITVVSDLQLRVKALPNNVYRGAQENLAFVLQEGGKNIEDKTFLALLKNSANLGFGQQDQVTKQVWTHDFSLYSVPEKGLYRVDLPMFRDMGNYDLEVLVDGKTFKRRFQHRITVREPFTAKFTEMVDDSGATQHVLSVQSHSQSINPKKTQIAATILNPDRRKSVKPLGLTEFDVWQTVVYTDLAGKYTIQVKVVGEELNGDTFEYNLPPLELDLNPDATFAEVVPTSIPVSSLSSAASSEAPSSTAMASSVASEQASEAIEPLSTEATPPPPNAGLPPWFLYVALGGGNLLVLGGGYFLFRKLMADPAEEFNDEFDEPVEVNSAIPPEPKKPEPVAERQEDLLAMDDGDGDDEEPPMEDLDPSEVDEPATVINAPVDDMTMEDDFGVDDLEDEASADFSQTTDINDNADLEAEMLRAQGLDLAEDELDDAISNLIDELDGEEPKKNKPADAADLDDFDFGDDDDDK